jgi:DNA polymerase III delta prime subunit
MIPPQISAKAPQGEQLLFRRIRDDPATYEWVIFHSFDIRRHVARTEGEADLVVAVPGLGVLCIEVKGCGVTRQGGLWIYDYDPPRKSPVGPFRQASDAAHSLRQYVASRDASFLPVIFCSAAFFTEIDFKERSMEWEPWQAVGKMQLLRNPVSKLVLEVLEAAHSKLRAMHPVPSWYGERSRPSSKQVDALVGLLRHDFEYAVVGGMALELAEQSIRRFTQEQFHAIDLIEENPRVLFKGPAGTGKTLLAVEAARRAVQSRRSVALVCFNSLLGAWLKRETAQIAAEARESGTRFFVGTVASLMLGIARVPVPDGAGSAFWTDELPGLATDVLLSGGPGFKPYDMLVIDEAQDLLSDPVLDVLELATSAGLAAGHWALFGDFERQAIYANADARPGLERLKGRTNSGYTNYPLRINCRNTRSIADVVTLASGLTPGYSRVLADRDPGDVEPVFYRGPERQVEQLGSVLQRLVKKFPPDQIVVLSMRSDAASCAAAAGASIQGIRLAPFKDETAKQQCVRFASVHSFKGLESAAVVLTDIDELDDEQAKALVYVGMTRARLALVLLMSDRVRKRYDSLLMEGYKATRMEGLT